MENVNAIEEGKAYLINGLAWPYTLPRRVPDEKLTEIDLGGFRLEPAWVDFQDGTGPSYTDGRFLLTFADRHPNDGQARRVAEALSMTLTLAYVPFASFSSPSLLKLPNRLINSRSVVQLRDLIADAEVVGEFEYYMGWEAGVRQLLKAAVGVSDDVIEVVMKALPVTMQDPYFEACRFYVTSVTEMSYSGGDIDLVLKGAFNHSYSALDTARAENAYQNAFKAIEALVGEPPSDERKFRSKLLDLGIDPDHQVGWAEQKIPTIERIRNIHKNRDTRVAHAGTPNRLWLTPFDILDAQGCAKAVLQQAVMHQMPGTGGPSVSGGSDSFTGQ